MDWAAAEPSSCLMCVVQQTLGAIFMLIPGFTQVHVASVHLEIDFKSAAGSHLAAVSVRALLAENARWLLSTADLCYGDLIPG